MAPDIKQCSICNTKFTDGEPLYWTYGEHICGHDPRERCIICSSCFHIYRGVLPAQPFCLFYASGKMPLIEDDTIIHVHCDPNNIRCSCSCSLCPVRHRCRQKNL